ncbi:MAG: Fur family transcriptional regulator [Caldilineaceae bacterium]
MQKLDLYLQALQQAGHRITAQRRAICEYLATTDRHPTPYEIYDDISYAHPEISRATVYNTLNVLQALGVIVEIAFGADHTHYDTDPTPHINLICLRCHSITDYHAPVDAALQAAQQEEIARNTGFQPVSARMDILGFCADCRARRRAEIIAQWNADNPTATNGPIASAQDANTETATS